jgi:hypothetical protein
LSSFRMRLLAQARNPYSLWQRLVLYINTGIMDSQMRNCAS